MPGWLAANIAVYLVPISTLIIGFVVGYMAQRSGFCSIGGFRDLLLFKQTRLFIGYLALIGGAALGYFIFSLIIPVAFPTYPKVVTGGFAALPGAPNAASVYGVLAMAVVGGIGLGLLGVLLGGCPLRQIVMSSEGNLNSIFFIIGLCVGVIIFYMFIVANLVNIINALFPA